MQAHQDAFFVSLSSQALTGLGGQEPDVSEAPPELADFLASLPPAEPQGRLLAAVGVWQKMRAAGLVLATADVPPPEPPPDPRPEAPPACVKALLTYWGPPGAGRFENDGDARAADELLAALAEKGYRAPYRLLPRLLENYASLPDEDALERFGGPRMRFLARQTPDWNKKWFFYPDSLFPVGADTKDISPKSKIKEFCAPYIKNNDIDFLYLILERFYLAEPEAAPEVYKIIFAELKDKKRAELIEKLFDSPIVTNFIPLLETLAADDSAPKTAVAAERLLIETPETKLYIVVCDALRECVRLTPDNELKINFAPLYDLPLKIRVSAESKEHYAQILFAAPAPSFWQKTLERSPETLWTAAYRAEDSLRALLGVTWSESVVRWEDARWANAALLVGAEFPEAFPTWPPTRYPAGGQAYTYTQADWNAVLHYADAEALSRRLCQILSAERPDAPYAAEWAILLLDALDGRWNAAVLRAAIQALGDNRPFFVRLYSALSQGLQAQAFAPPELSPEITRALETTPMQASFFTILRRASERLRLRLEALNSL